MASRLSERASDNPSNQEPFQSENYLYGANMLAQLMRWLGKPNAMKRDQTSDSSDDGSLGRSLDERTSSLPRINLTRMPQPLSIESDSESKFSQDSLRGQLKKHTFIGSPFCRDLPHRHPKLKVILRALYHWPALRDSWESFSKDRRIFLRLLHSLHFAFPKCLS